MSQTELKNYSPWTQESRKSASHYGHTSKLTNTINNIGFGAFNHKGVINHSDILNSYSPKILEETWTQLSNFIKKNYESGKGTTIKGFGTFTFMNPEYNLEGTTNQYQRDFKLRRPVFIVSNEFLDFLRPGQFTKRGGLIYYTQKLNNKVSLVKFNFTELAFSLNISKEECQNIVTTIIKDMADEIVARKFRSRELPGLGIILIRGNIFGVKFFSEFNLDVYKKVEKLNFTKNNIELFMNVHKTDQAHADLLNAEKAVKELNPKDSVITHLVHGADEWLQNNLGIHPNDFDNNIETHQNFNKVENYDRNKKWESKTFFKAESHNKLYKTPQGLMRTNSNIKNNNGNGNDTSISTNQDSRNNSGKLSLKNLNFPREILEALVANKGQIIREMKSYDKRNNGLISRFEIARSFYKANCHPALSMNSINDIIKVYENNADYIEYYKLITSLIKDIKQILKGTSFCKYGFDDLSSTFNNKFKLGKIITDGKMNRNLSVSVSNKNRNGNLFEEEKNTFKFNLDEYLNMNVPIVEVEKEINTIKLIFDEIMYHKETYFKSADLDIFKDDNYPINYSDFIRLLKVFNITYPRDKVLKILKFMNIENPLKMTLNIINDKLKKCKISSYEMSSQELEYALKDILFSSRLNLKKELFDDSQKINEGITLKTFLKKTHNKTKYTDNILTELFYKITNKNEILKYNDFISLYENPIYTKNDTNINNTKNNLTQRFFEQSCEKILSYSKKLNKTAYQYFDHLLSYNYLRKDNTMGVTDFVLAILQEPFEPQFTEEQLEFIFYKMDTNKDGRLDRNEFRYAITKENNALLKMQDIVKKLRLTIDDLSYRLEIGKEPENQNWTFYQFKNRLKKMDSYYTNEFIEGLYIELVGSLDKMINCKYLLDNLNVYKNGTFIQSNNDTFKTNFISNIQKNVDFHTLKAAFEKEDKNFSGKITKAHFCKVINLFTKEFKDEDIMKFVRICKLTDTITYEVNYSDFLNMIYYNEKLDKFLLCVNEIKKLCDSLGKDITKTLNYLNGNDNNTTNVNYISIDKLLSYLKSKIETEEYFSNVNNTPLTKTLICKFDLDADGKISFEDLRGILQRYANTSFFKYENSEKSPNVNLYASDYLSDEQFKAIVREIKSTMKKKNITEVGLFKKLDEDNDGFINNYEFNKNIEGIIEISPATKDRFFNYLDYYHNGMVDLETFLLRFKEFKSNEVIVNNNNNIENVILDKLAKFISRQSKRMNDAEIFSLMDKDSDGIISLDDFKFFVIDSLGISKIEFNDYKLERVMQSISLSKNKNIGLGDVREFMNKALAKGINSYYVDLKETFKETANQNLFRGKKNTEWITQAIERFGMYITETYDGAKKFFEKFADNKLNKFKFEHFIKFHENNFECFHGFNLTRDELLAIFTSLDSQKKNYLTLEDLQKKVELFDFYRKMHLDIKNFLNENFPSQIDSFKFFLPTDLNRMNKPGGSNLMSLDYSNKQMKRGKSFTRTFTKGFNRPFDSSGIINSQASGTILQNSFKNGFNNNLNNKKLLTYLTKKQFFDGINILFPKKYPTETILKYMEKYFNISREENNEEQKITFSQYVFVYYGISCHDNDLFLGNIKDTNTYISNQKRINLSNKRQNKLSNTRTQITARCLSAFDEINTKNELGRKPLAHNLYPNEEEILGLHPLTHMDHPLEYLAHQKLMTPFDNDPLEKVRRIIVSSPNQNYIDKMKKFLDEHKIKGGICNEFEFKNMLKNLYLGLTNIEIDDIIRKSGKTYDGKLNVNDFFKFVTSRDKNINKAENNLNITLAEIKQLLYKYYSNPKLAFTFIDSSQSNTMDFEKYRAIISELYKREEKPMPNFALLKNTYDFIDLRKDGLIDMVEWTNAFGNMKGKLDAIKPKNKEQKKQLKKLRKWETSNDIISIYKDISRSRKLILQEIKDTAFGPNSTIIHEDNLIKVLKNMFPYFKLTNTQWRMIVEIGDKDTQGFINFDTFIKLVENCARREEMPRMK